MLYAALVVLLVAVDQLVKLLVRANIPMYGSMPFIPYLFDLTYVQNTGAAFNSFAEYTWVLTIVSAVVALAIAVVLFKRVFAHPFGVISLSVVLAGAVGNLIDRLFLGYVTDMFQFLPFSFAVFNVADICVVLGGAAFFLYFLFFYEKWEKKGTANGPDSPEG